MVGFHHPLEETVFYLTQDVNAEQGAALNGDSAALHLRQCALSFGKKHFHEG